MTELELGNYWHCMNCGKPTVKGELKCTDCMIRETQEILKEESKEITIDDLDFD